MPVKRCFLCAEDREADRLYRGSGLAEGEICPLCYRPACTYHLSLVRWRWRNTGEYDATRICRSCHRTYLHRGWDVANRDWIS